jgi:hypothetical protein
MKAVLFRLNRRPLFYRSGIPSAPRPKNGRAVLETAAAPRVRLPRPAEGLAAEAALPHLMSWRWRRALGRACSGASGAPARTRERGCAGRRVARDLLLNRMPSLDQSRKLTETLGD